MGAKRLVIVFIVAAVLAAGSFFLSRMAMQSAPAVVAQTEGGQIAAPQPPADTTKVLVAGIDLPSGSLIQANSLLFRDWPRSAIDENSFVVEGQATLEDFQGAVVRSGIRSGQPVAKSNLIKRNESGFLAAVLKPGMRAVTVTVNEGTGVAGFVFPGDTVDLVLSHTIQIKHAVDNSTHPHDVSETLFHGIRVIAVDQRAGDQEQLPAVSRVVTLEVTPEQSEGITLAQKMGEIRLVLRALAKTEDGAEAALQPADADERTYTMDYNLSQVISSAGGTADDKDGQVSSMIQVVRGGQGATDIQPK